MAVYVMIATFRLDSFLLSTIYTNDCFLFPFFFPFLFLFIYLTFFFIIIFCRSVYMYQREAITLLGLERLVVN
jgi:hypothetical protein